ncbi:hypothetical protein, partial [Bradyrhizobium sp. NBAIM08]|uniref:hypothetical protein n=1 Tax=Bradyrhizobium sp. NBAIM08 TaxID=2793815 RepID=UPI001CD50020
FFVTAMTPSSVLRRVIIAPGSDRARTAEVMAMLRLQGIEVQQLPSPLVVAAAHDYLHGTTARRTFPEGSFVIDMAQPRGRLAAALLEPTHVLDSTFARTQVERFERNRRRGEAAQREGYEFYDVTAWSLP